MSEGNATATGLVKKEDKPKNGYIDPRQVQQKEKPLKRKTLSGQLEVPMTVGEQQEFCLWVYEFFLERNCDPLLLLLVLHGEIFTTMLSATIALAVYDKPDGVTQEELEATIETIFPSKESPYISQQGVAYKVQMLLSRAAKPLLVKDKESGRISFTTDKKIAHKAMDYLEGLSNRKPNHSADEQLKSFNAVLTCLPDNYQDFRPVLEEFAESIVTGGFKKRKLYLYYALDLMYRRSFTSPLTRQLVEFVPETEGITLEDWEKASQFRCIRPKDICFEYWSTEKREWSLGEGGVVELKADGKIYRTDWCRRMLAKLDNVVKDRLVFDINQLSDSSFMNNLLEQARQIVSTLPAEDQLRFLSEVVATLPQEEAKTLVEAAAGIAGLESKPAPTWVEKTQPVNTEEKTDRVSLAAQESGESAKKNGWEAKLDRLTRDFKEVVATMPDEQEEHKTVANLRAVYDEIDQVKAVLNERVREFLNPRLKAGSPPIPEGTEINYRDNKESATGRSPIMEFRWSQERKERTRAFGYGLLPKHPIERVGSTTAAL